MAASGSIWSRNVVAGTVIATSITADDLEVDGTTLSIDETNNRVGVGVIDPDSTLEVFSTTTQQKWSYDSDSSATITVADASHTTIATSETGDLILDAGDDIILDSHAGKWRMKRNGTLTNMISATAADGSKMVFDNQVSNAGYDFKCSDGGVGITALSIDAANAGAATFNNKVTATELDISGDCDIDGTMEADAITVNGTALDEVIADTVGAMVGSNTETNITVSYDDNDNTLDFVVGTLNQSTTGTAAIATTVTCADESSDATCFVGYVTAATGDLGVKTGSNLTFNSSNGTLGATEFSGGGVGVTGLNGTQVTSGTVAAARVATLNQDTTGTAAIATTVTVADESSDTSCNVLFTAAATGNLAPKSGTNLTFNSSNGLLTATSLAGTLTTAAQTNITSVGTIGTGVWQGTKVASAYLDDDTAHLSGTQTFTGTKTLNSFKGTGAITVTNILDEDAMGTDSDTALATQQSIKAYADTKSPLAGSSSITTVGTIATGTWNATVIASAKLDDDTAHLTTTQTFTGAKTFTGGVTIDEGELTLGSTAVSSTAAELNNLDAITRGSIIYGNASAATARLAKGGAGTVLTSDGTDIAWAAAGGTPADDSNLIFHMQVFS